MSKLRALGWSPTRTVQDSVTAYKAWLDRADDLGEILAYARRQMAALNVVREI